MNFSSSSSEDEYDYYGGSMDLMLGPQEVEKIAGSDLKLTISPDFKDINSIDDLFYPNSNKALLLYQTEDYGNMKIGHWCCLLRFSNNDIAFYDSYGDMPDIVLKTMPDWYRKKTGQTRKELSRLLHDSKYKYLHYNPHQHQEHYRGINTCGRHCGLFLRLGLDPEIYNNVLNNLSKSLEKTPDELVTELTDPILYSNSII